LKGRILSGRITAVSLEFNQCFSSFASKTYDVLDPDDESFKGDFLKFQERILELDMKLAVSKKICMMIIDQLYFYINSQDLNL
jgi:dynein heavy chain